MAAPFVLSVEDNDGDYFLMEFVLKHCLDGVDLHRATDGEQAVAFLKSSATSNRSAAPGFGSPGCQHPTLERLRRFDIHQVSRSYS
jgi:hypothetical protein